MKVSVFAVAVGVLAAALVASAGIVEHDESHLWTGDAAAYRNYREEATGGEASPRISSAIVFPAPIEAIDGAYLVDSLRTLAGEKNPVLANRGKSAGRAAARAFLRAEFESFGFTVREESYRTGVNLVAERAGKSGKFLVVSAHFDSVNNAGADDDATGVVSMLATAKVLKDRPLENGVRFVAFDEEELGLVGSAAYVAALVKRGEKATILGDLQMEMMAYNHRKDGKFHVISCDRADSRFLADAFSDVVGRMASGLKITTTCTDRSDHSSFWDAGIGAVVISENFFGGDANPCYHKACDRTDILDFGYFEKMANASANVVLGVAFSPVVATPPPAPSNEEPRPAPTAGTGGVWPRN